MKYTTMTEYGSHYVSRYDLDSEAKKCMRSLNDERAKKDMPLLAYARWEINLKQARRNPVIKVFFWHPDETSLQSTDWEI